MSIYKSNIEKDDELRRKLNRIRRCMNEVIQIDCSGYLSCEVSIDDSHKIWEFLFIDVDTEYRDVMVHYKYNGSKSTCTIYFNDVLGGNDRNKAKKPSYNYRYITNVTPVDERKLCWYIFSKCKEFIRNNSDIRRDLDELNSIFNK